MSANDALQLVKALCGWRVVSTTPELVVAALDLSREHQISAWDAAIIEAARVAGCQGVLSEDLSSGQDYPAFLTAPLIRGEDCRHTVRQGVDE
jgi:predicted nucleic acid-binding protein